MSKINRGKQFEDVVREGFERLPDVSIDRLHDQTTHYKGSTNICDFIVYKKPIELYLECKSVHGNTFSIFGNDEKHKYGNVTNTQWEGLLEKAKIRGVTAGVLIWFVDCDVTVFASINFLNYIRANKYKSLNVKHIDGFISNGYFLLKLKGQKKRVFFDYDMEQFLLDVQYR